MFGLARRSATTDHQPSTVRCGDGTCTRIFLALTLPNCEDEISADDEALFIELRRVVLLACMPIRSTRSPGAFPDSPNTHAFPVFPNTHRAERAPPETRPKREGFAA
jgi:hypothetical protein